MPDKYDEDKYAEDNCAKEERQTDASDARPVGRLREASEVEAMFPESVDFEAWLLQMQPGMLRLSWSILRDWSLASDAVQEAFSLFSQKWGEIEPEHRTGWLVRTVQLQAMSLRRKRARLVKHQVEWSAVPPTLLGKPASAEEELFRRERVERLQQEIDKLPSEQKSLVRLRLREERTFAEIATELGQPIGTVLSRMRLAVQKLRNALRDDESSRE